MFIDMIALLGECVCVCASLWAVMCVCVWVDLWLSRAGAIATRGPRPFKLTASVSIVRCALSSLLFLILLAGFVCLFLAVTVRWAFLLIVRSPRYADDGLSSH